MRLLAAIALLTGFTSTAAAQTEAHGLARGVYRKLCANCHGADLHGGMASSLVDGVWAFGENRSKIFSNIHDGISDRGMPGFGRVLSRADVDALIDFIQSMARPDVAEDVIPETISTLDYAIKVERFVEGLEIPWAIDFIDAGTALVEVFSFDRSWQCDRRPAVGRRSAWWWRGRRRWR